MDVLFLQSVHALWRLFGVARAVRLHGNDASSRVSTELGDRHRMADNNEIRTGSPSPIDGTGTGEVSSLAWVAALAGWIVIVGAGMAGLWLYANTPGPDAAAAATWPRGSSLPRDPQWATLVMFVHPHCPCSRASVAELERAVTKSAAQFAAIVIFVRPEQFEPGWEKTDLWTSAKRVPGVMVACDETGREARQFGARTSGQTFLYARNGELLFAGGLTASRGHQGDNAGRYAIESLLTTGIATTRRSPVFGCPLFDASACNSEGSSCCQL